MKGACLLFSQQRVFRPSYQDLGTLRFGFHSNRVPIRILAEWDSCSLHNYYDVMMNYIILDSQNTQYWAVIDFAERKHFRPLLCVGLLYSMSGFRIAPATAPAKPIDTDRIIILSQKTKLTDLLSTCGISRFKFNLGCWHTFVSQLEHPTKLSDACGVVKSVGNIDYHTNDIERLDLTLVMSSLQEVKVSLWGMKSALFEMNFVSHRQRNVVVVITGLSTRQKKGTIYLSSTPSTNISFEPTFDEIRDLGRVIASEYGEFICPIPHETHFGTRLHPKEGPPNSTLGAILATPLWVHQKVNTCTDFCNLEFRPLLSAWPTLPYDRSCSEMAYVPIQYCCSVTIVNVVLFEQTRTIYCKSCKDHAGLDANNYYCPRCGRNYVTQLGSMGIPMLVKDRGCTAILIIRGRELKQLTGFHVNDFLAYYKDVKDNYRTHCCIRKIIGSTCTFELELAPAAYSNSIGDLLIKRVLQYTRLRENQPLP